MPEEDKIAFKIKISDLTDKLDKKALAGAVGVMLMSWLGLPIVYWLIIRKNKKNTIEDKEEKK